MLRRVFTLAAAGTVFLGATESLGQTILFANLTNGAENPPAVPTLTNGQPRPASFGTVIGILAADQMSLTLEMEVFNIDFTGSQTDDTNDNLTNAHIHASPTVTPTTNAGVVWGFIGAPFNDTNPTDTVVTPFATGVGGTVVTKWDAPEGNSGTTLTAQLSNLLTEHAYVNFHTAQFGGGEVRGTLTVVPEPVAAALLAPGALLALRRRRRHG